MDSATGDRSHKRRAEKEFCFIPVPIPSPWIQEYKVAPLIRKAHLDELGIVSRSRERKGKGSIFSRRTFLGHLRTFSVMLTLLKHFSDHSTLKNTGPGCRHSCSSALAPRPQDSVPNTPGRGVPKL